MKKIISALTLGAMVAGAAFADVGVTLNYRQRATLLSHNNEYTKDGVKKEEASKILFTDAYSGSGTDNLGINLGGDRLSELTCRLVRLVFLPASGQTEK